MPHAFRSKREPTLRAKWKRDAAPRRFGLRSGDPVEFRLDSCASAMGKADLKLPENDVGLAIKFSAYFYKLTLPAGTFKQRGSFNPAVD